MRVVITGSRDSITTGHVMNDWMHEYFKDHEVIQLSRSTGYDFNTNYANALEIAKSADIFVNSAAIGDCQVRFLNDLYGIVPKIISLGSIAADFSEAFEEYYPKMKRELKFRNKMLPLEKLNDSSELLHITISEVENQHFSRSGVTYEQISKILDFWFEYPIFNNIDLKFFIDDGYQTIEKIEKVAKVVQYYANNQTLSN